MTACQPVSSGNRDFLRQHDLVQVQRVLLSPVARTPLSQNVSYPLRRTAASKISKTGPENRAEFVTYLRCFGGNVSAATPQRPRASFAKGDWSACIETGFDASVIGQGRPVEIDALEAVDQWREVPPRYREWCFRLGWISGPKGTDAASNSARVNDSNVLRGGER